MFARVHSLRVCAAAAILSRKNAASFLERQSYELVRHLCGQSDHWALPKPNWLLALILSTALSEQTLTPPVEGPDTFMVEGVAAPVTGDKAGRPVRHPTIKPLSIARRPGISSIEKRERFSPEARFQSRVGPEKAYEVDVGTIWR